ncbi:MAG: hypothetical protein GY821_13455 [Gammaproteobacteria bacterium]|nr:hypothetical protein [Gammaproteobacteria bacterium]
MLLALELTAFIQTLRGISVFSSLLFPVALASAVIGFVVDLVQSGMFIYKLMKLLKAMGHPGDTDRDQNILHVLHKQWCMLGMKSAAHLIALATIIIAATVLASLNPIAAILIISAAMLVLSIRHCQV